jgi:hypothetical protein
LSESKSLKPSLPASEVPKTSLREMCLLIRSNKQFRRIILDAKPLMRRAVYDQLAPLLSFKAKPYFLLIR